MKRKLALVMACLFLSTNLTACSNIEESISSEEAVERIEERYGEDLDIISVELDSNTYVVEWKTRDGLEWRRERLKKNGDIETIEGWIE